MEQTPTKPLEVQGAPARPCSQPSPTDGSPESKAVTPAWGQADGRAWEREEAGSGRWRRAAGLHGERGRRIELSWHRVNFSLTVTRWKGGWQGQVLDGLVVEKCQSLSTLHPWLGNESLSCCRWAHITLSPSSAPVG